MNGIATKHAPRDFDCPSAQAESKHMPACKIPPENFTATLVFDMLFQYSCWEGCDPKDPACTAMSPILAMAAALAASSGANKAAKQQSKTGLDRTDYHRFELHLTKVKSD